MPVFRKRIILNDFANLYIYLTVLRKFWKMLLSTTATSGDKIIHFSLFSVLYPVYYIIDPRDPTHLALSYFCASCKLEFFLVIKFIFVQLSWPCFCVLYNIEIKYNLHHTCDWEMKLLIIPSLLKKNLISNQFKIFSLICLVLWLILFQNYVSSYL